MATENLTIVYPKGAMEVRGGTPIAQDGTVANNANAYGVLEADIKWPETTGAVIVSGEVNYDWACSNSGIGIVKEAADAMSGITFVQDDGEPYVFPCSGGGNGNVMVVNFEVNPQTTALTADKTVDEVKTAMLTMPVIGVLKAIVGETVVSSSGIGCATIDSDANPAFGCYYDAANNYWMKQIGVVDDNWAFGVEE